MTFLYEIKKIIVNVIIRAISPFCAYTPKNELI
jgi:hypothetical protein